MCIKKSAQRNQCIQYFGTESSQAPPRDHITLIVTFVVFYAPSDGLCEKFIPERLTQKLQCILRFMDTRFVDITRFVDGCEGHEKSKEI